MTSVNISLIRNKQSDSYNIININGIDDTLDDIVINVDETMYTAIIDNEEVYFKRCVNIEEFMTSFFFDIFNTKVEKIEVTINE